MDLPQETSLQDAYLFIEEASSETLLALESMDGVRRVTRLLSGKYVAVAFLEADGIEALSTVITNVRDALVAAGAGPTDEAIPLRFAGSSADQPKIPSRWMKLDVCALVRVRARQGQAGEVLDGAHAVPGFGGGAIVAGTFDVLLEFSWSSMNEAKQTLLGQVATLQGVRWMDVAISLGAE
jgi:hypothetical protein